jgi:hypothetical protein
MANTHVTFDTRSGQILSVHLGAADAHDARRSAQHHPEFSDEHVDVIEVSSASVESDKHYKVDVGGGGLIEVSPEEGGVRFGFGVTGETSGTPTATG